MVGRNRADPCVLCWHSAIRNRSGLRWVTRFEESFRNAERVTTSNGRRVTEERAHTFPWDVLIVFWNVFYGTFHFAVTIGAMVILFARYPRRYTFMRSTLAATTTVALVGFVFPADAAPTPGEDSRFGACEPDSTSPTPGRSRRAVSFESGTMETISNQYAAMPSLHVAWAVWCTVALYPVLRSRWSRRAIVAYPILTLFAIVVTANHYWIDAVGGLLALGIGLKVAPRLTRLLPGPPGTLTSDVARRSQRPDDLRGRSIAELDDLADQIVI